MDSSADWRGGGLFPLCPGSRHIGAVALWANILVAAVSHGSSLGMMFMCDHGQVHFLLLSFPIFLIVIEILPDSGED